MGAGISDAVEAYSPAVEDYTKAVFVLQERLGESVPTKDLAFRLGVTAGSVSSMVPRLMELGLIERTRYRGVELTEEGRRVAVKIVRKHRLIETFLNQQGGVSWDKVHDVAERIEHSIPDEVIETISAEMGHPAVDPHGDPIPEPNGTFIPAPHTPSLAELTAGASGRLARVSDSDPEMLRYLADRKVKIGNKIEVSDQPPFEGDIEVLVDDQPMSIPRKLAAVIRVELDA
jgi:DtxR family Mn-dependent transcriptional regulator